MKPVGCSQADLLARTTAGLEFEFMLEVELAEHDPLLESLLQRLDDAGC